MPGLSSAGCSTVQSYACILLFALTFSVKFIIPGIVMLLFFRCMGALYNPNNRMKEGIKWGLIAYTAAMFLFVTIFTATNLGIQSISYIDNREFFCANSTDCQPGPLGYQPLINSKTISVCRNLMFLLNSLQAGGLLVSSLFSLITQRH